MNLSKTMCAIGAAAAVSATLAIAPAQAAPFARSEAIAAPLPVETVGWRGRRNGGAIVAGAIGLGVLGIAAAAAANSNRGYYGGDYYGDGYYGGYVPTGVYGGAPAYGYGYDYAYPAPAYVYRPVPRYHARPVYGYGYGRGYGYGPRAAYYPRNVYRDRGYRNYGTTSVRPYYHDYGRGYVRTRDIANRPQF